MSPYPAGNQCWDSGTARTVWNALNSPRHSATARRRRRRRHVYNFDVFPRRRWQLPIRYTFNDTVPSVSDLGLYTEG